MNTNTNMTHLIRSKILTQIRSLPSRHHPLIPRFSDHLHRHRAAASSSSSPDSSLAALDDLHVTIHDLLLLPHTRHVITRDANEKWVSQILDGYLALVDAAATARDHLAHAADQILHLLSLLRRRSAGGGGGGDNLSQFLASRKIARKQIQKSLKSITNLKQKPSVFNLDKDAETVAVIGMLKEAEAATLDAIESLLCSVAGASPARQGAWSRVSRLIGTRRRASGQDHELCDVDSVLDKIVGLRRLDSSKQIDDQLKETEKSLRHVEERVERLFKRLIKTRVELLNMHSN